MNKKIKYGKESIVKVDGNRLTEISQSIVDGDFVLPQKRHTEENVEVHSRAEQDAEYIAFADEEERLQESGRLVDADFQIRRTPAAAKRGARYAVKKFTLLLDKGFNCDL